MSVIAEFAGLVGLLGYLVSGDRNATVVPPSRNLQTLSKNHTPAKLDQIPTSDESDSEDSNSENADIIHLNEPTRHVVRARGPTTATTAVAALAAWKGSFPWLGGQSYAFTFKMMIHEIYNFEEWAEKAKRALQESQRRFRPLAKELNRTTCRVTAAMKRTRNEEQEQRLEPEPESSESENNSETSIEAKNKDQDHYGRALKRRCVVRSRPTKDDGWVYEAVASCVDGKMHHIPFQPRRRPALRLKKTEATPFLAADILDVQSDDEEFYEGLKKITIRERRVTIVDDVDSDSEGDVSDVESEDSGPETVDKHDMRFRPQRQSTPRPKTIKVEATPSSFEDVLDVPSDDEDFYEALKKITVRERRMTIIDDVDSDSEWDTDDEEWDEQAQGMSTTGYQGVNS